VPGQSGHGVSVNGRAEGGPPESHTEAREPGSTTGRGQTSVGSERCDEVASPAVSDEGSRMPEASRRRRKEQACEGGSRSLVRSSSCLMTAIARQKKRELGRDRRTAIERGRACKGRVRKGSAEDREEEVDGGGKEADERACMYVCMYV
jgi:hypothetical protein